MKHSTWLASLLVAVSGCTGTEIADIPARHTANDQAREEARRDLMAVFEASDEQKVAADPLGAIGRGDLRNAEDFGDYITRKHIGLVEQQTRANLARLMAIDRELLSATDQISFDVFRYQQELVIRGNDSGAKEILRHLPLDHLFGYHVAFPDMSSGESFMPFNTLTDYENGLSRLEGFATYLRRAEDAMREGIAAGHVLPRFAAVKVIEQLRDAIAQGVEESPLVAPTKSFPPEVGAEDSARLSAAYRASVGTTVLPAYRELAEFMETVYLPASRTGVPGLTGMPDGDDLYRYLVAQHTETTLSPDVIHQIGRDEVARIRGEMEAIMRQVGFDGKLPDFFRFLRSDSKFQFATEAGLLQAYEDIWKRLEPAMPALFATLPRTAFEIRAVPDFLEKTAGGAYYNAGTPDGSRPGVFYVNTSDLPSRTSSTMETLFLHEAMPGHHLQASLVQENESLPAFLRFGWSTAFIEGWALYAESLGTEVGLFRDPFQHFGHLDLEMFRALRLVVDTGLHVKGWSRHQAVDYMLNNSSLSKPVLASDVDRYLVWPGQALAYKLGQLKIQRLRTEAEQRIGDVFDVRAFHDQILGSGILPIPILEGKVRAWIESQHVKNQQTFPPIRPNKENR